MTVDAESDGRTRHSIASTSELRPGERMLVEIEGLEILIVNIDGEYHGVGNYCVHQAGPLADGHISGHIIAQQTNDGWNYEYTCEDQVIACPWHGWQFDLTSGRHIGSDDYRIPTFDIIVEADTIYLLL